MIQAIIGAFSSALSAVFNFIPRLVGFLVILLIGWLVGIGVEKVLTLLLRKVGFERLSERVGLSRLERRIGLRMDASQLLGKVAFWFVFLIFLVPATDALGLPTVSSTLNALVDYIPNIFVAILVLFLGALLGIFIGDIVRNATRNSRIGSPNIFGGIVRWAIIGFSALIALEQLQIAPSLIVVLFTSIMGALALAFGLAFGLGGRESAQRLLARTESNVMVSRPYDPNQITQQARSDLEYSDRLGQQQQSAQRQATTPPMSQSQQTVPPFQQGYTNEPQNQRPNPRT
jgi:hypothetical protein